LDFTSENFDFYKSSPVERAIEIYSRLADVAYYYAIVTACTDTQ